MLLWAEKDVLHEELTLLSRVLYLDLRLGARKGLLMKKTGFLLCVETHNYRMMICLKRTRKAKECLLAAKYIVESCSISLLLRIYSGASGRLSARKSPYTKTWHLYTSPYQILSIDIHIYIIPMNT